MNFLKGLYRNRRGAARLAVAVAAASALAACDSSDGTGDGAGSEGGPRVVAASTWEAAFARAAGARDVDVIVPPGINHPPDYDPKPSDIAKVAGADFVLYAPFEGFAPKLKSAVGSKAEMVELQLDNSPNIVRKEVTRLGQEFGTAGHASKWLTSYDAAYATEKRKATAAYAKAGKPPVVAQTFVGWAADLLGADPVRFYGPQPPTAPQVADLASWKPGLILENSAMPRTDALSSIKAARVTVVNFPDQKMDLKSVYRTNTTALTAALTD
ncbi:metal ABC transporter solute-binding protein, Zn/Mn family [Actinomadura luteofluorescens]|uniref:metal ABC transporter solute-binding protein, Zn/Mn family n=1 Tax=Actinomadura luteofluorescens TaxID=46163 RepID=UPI003483D9BE